MIRITRAHAQPIGVDFGFDSVKLLQLEVSGNHLSVVAAVRHLIPEELREVPESRLTNAMEAVDRLLRTGGFIGRHVATSLPREFVQVKNLRLPHMPVAELDAAVEFEAKNIFSFDTDQSQVRFLHAGEVRQGSDAREELIVLAAKNDDVDNYVEQLHRHNLVVDSLDFEPCSLYRSVERFVRRREDEAEVHVIVDIGVQRTHVVIGKGREMSFFKPIDIGGQHLLDAVSRKLGITPSEARALRRRLMESTDAMGEATTKRDPVRQAVSDATRSIIEDLAREISLCLRYHSVTFRGHRPSRVQLTGGEANDPYLVFILNSNLPLQASAWSPLSNVNTDQMKPHDRRGFLSEWTVAFGLGMKRTNMYFGSRDGKRRDPNAPREDVRSAGEVIDLTQAVLGNPHGNSAVPVEQVPVAVRTREVARA